jgi:hypothetical protein
MTEPPGWTPPAEPGAAPGPPPPAWGQQPAWQQQQQWGGYYQAPKPGVIPLRPLGLGEILDGTFGVVREYPGVTLGLSAIVVTFTQLVTFAISAYSRLNAGYGGSGRYGGITGARIFAWVLSGVGSAVLAGMLTAVIGEAVLGRKTTIGATWKKVRPRFWALIGASILGVVVPFVALIPFVVPGVFLWGAWAFLTPVVVLEGAGVGMSIRRSWRLAVPSFWRVWGTRALSVVIAGIIQSVITIPAVLLAFGSVGFQPERTSIGIVPLAIIAVGGIVANTITAPFTSGVLSLLYIDRRMRAEGLDVTLARAASSG